MSAWSLRCAALVARSAAIVSRLTKQGGGTTLPGVVLLRLQPNAVADLGKDLTDGSVLISATNGKTTTARLVSAWARTIGPTIVTNAAGSNLERGIAAALLDREDAELGIFEVDEAALPKIAASLGPNVIALLNLFRDQLDRYGELDTLFAKWEAMLDTETGADENARVVVLNADDPNIASLAQPGRRSVLFGIEDPTVGLETLAHAADATTCRRCGAPIIHDVVLLGHLGHWRCTACNAQRPKPDVRVVEVTAHGVDGIAATVETTDIYGVAQEATIDSPLPGLHNVYNIVAAIAIAQATCERLSLPFELADAAARIAATSAAFGRGEQVTVDDRYVNLMLAKNPTGVNQNLRTVLAGPEQVDLLLALNDRTADGRDISWIWDVDWEVLRNRIAHLTITGDRAWDLALRFRYGGIEIADESIIPEPHAAFDSAIARTRPGGRLDVLPTYTAMLDLRSLLTERGHTSAYWQE